MTGASFASFDPERFMDRADAWLAEDTRLQESLLSLVGRARDEDGLVTVEYGGGGLRELELHPKAMRLSSGELAERIKAVMDEAAADLQRQYLEAMDQVYGEQDNPMRYLSDPDSALAKVRQAEADYNRTFQDVMGQLDHVSRRLGL
ncbi:MAG TPA: YbaB/EbfC family nucleoid-associated protein [Thermopolyspora sp.]